MNGKLINIAMIMTIATPVVLGVFLKTKSRKRQKLLKKVEEHTALFEPEREKEIRAILAKDPEFNTHCYTCIHFEQELFDCRRKLSADPALQPVTEVTINESRYCLNWAEA